ncbi:MAG: hypothetical protein K2P04_02405 [Oscillospiraceae bacterium]|nr:hypothetical protein [Oscillospiraceae bacterium]
MKPETLYGILALAAIGVVIFIFMQLKEKKNKSLAESGEDKARLKDVAARVFAGVDGVSALYGHYEHVQHYGRSTRTTYYRYLLAHDSQRLWIAPLDFQQGSILPAQPMEITKDDLGKAEVQIRTAKDGSTTRVEFTLYDKDGKQIVQAWASAENLRESRFYPVNILQEEECARFGKFMTGLAAQVNEENQALNDEMARQANKSAGKTSTILAIIGIIVGIFLPIAGIIMGAIAIAMAPKKSDNFGKTPASRILGIICICTSIIFGAVMAIYTL